MSDPVSKRKKRCGEGGRERKRKEEKKLPLSLYKGGLEW